MTYGKVLKGRFIDRPNRFIARVRLGQREVVCHVKNTGRCKELFIPGAAVFLEDRRQKQPAGKTEYSLIGVKKGGRLVNVDSQAPNKVLLEKLREGKLIPDIEAIRPEYRFGDSRFDFYAQARGKKYLIEVKGATLEEEGIALFPDAPTLRGLKHVQELRRARREGFEACLVFVIQMKGITYFTPNRVMQPDFYEAVKAAKEEGVAVLAWDCDVKPNSLTMASPVEIRL